MASRFHCSVRLVIHWMRCGQSGQCPLGWKLFVASSGLASCMQVQLGQWVRQPWRARWKWKFGLVEESTQTHTHTTDTRVWFQGCSWRANTSNQWRRNSGCFRLAAILTQGWFRYCGWTYEVCCWRYAMVKYLNVRQILPHYIFDTLFGTLG